MIAILYPNNNNNNNNNNNSNNNNTNICKAHIVNISAESQAPFNNAH